MSNSFRTNFLNSTIDQPIQDVSLLDALEHWQKGEGQSVYVDPIWWMTDGPGRFIGASDIWRAAGSSPFDGELTYRGKSYNDLSAGTSVFRDAYVFGSWSVKVSGSISQLVDNFYEFSLHMTPWDDQFDFEPNTNNRILETARSFAHTLSGTGAAFDIVYPGSDGRNIDGVFFYTEQFGFQPITALNNYEASDFTKGYRSEIAQRFGRVDHSRISFQSQLDVFEDKNYSRAESLALINFREKYKQNKDLESAILNLEQLGIVIPDPENEVWAFCFAGETEISMADGSKKRIDQIVAGDEVLAFSEFDEDGKGELVPRKVVRLFHELTDTWLKLSNGVSVTPGHMFLTTDGTYEPISEILEHRDGEVVLEDGTVKRLTAELVEFSAENAEKYPSGSMWVAESEGAVALEPRQKFGWLTYNFEVEDLHTYVAGGIRVHNTCIQKETKLNVVDNFIGTSGREITRIMGEDGSTNDVYNDNVEVQHGMVFSKIPGGGKYEYSVINRFGQKMLLTKEQMKDRNYNVGEHKKDYDPEEKSGKPIILDLDGNGVQVNELTSSNFFYDMDGDGKANRTAWAAAGDGVLVRDEGNDGVIELKQELDFTAWAPSAKSTGQKVVASHHADHPLPL